MTIVRNPLGRGIGEMGFHPLVRRFLRGRLAQRYQEEIWDRQRF